MLLWVFRWFIALANLGTSWVALVRVEFFFRGYKFFFANTMLMMEELRLTAHQWERARKDAICPTIQLEDPHCLIECPSEPPASEHSPSLFFLRFDGDEPMHHSKAAQPMLVSLDKGGKNNMLTKARHWMKLRAPSTNALSPH